MGVLNVKIIKLHIERLHGHYNYDDIVFNPDVTFIYGLNGCGKTTVLNITEAIITGQIFKLFEYSFDNIKLEYAHKRDIAKIQEISIFFIKPDKLEVIYRGEKYIIENNVNAIGHLRGNDRNMLEKARCYFNEYPFLMEIKKIFNYVYLPLNRSSVVYDVDTEDEYFMMRHARSRRFGGYEPINEPAIKDSAMIRVESLIFESYNRINTLVSNISDRFRDDILKSLLDVNEQYNDSNDLLDQIVRQQHDVSNIKQTKSAYIKILNEFSLITQEEEEHYTRFFNTIINDIQKYKKELSITALLKIYEIIRLQKLVSLTAETEEMKAVERKPIEVFLKTMNDFINTSEEEKEIKIDAFGRVYFTTKYNKNPISIQYLSSGEKQLMTFFANLIFKVNSNTSGIFVVDEPELSLHLSWQKEFVEKTLGINKNIQLIFATHAPELIGKRRNKMFRLEKKYID